MAQRLIFSPMAAHPVLLGIFSHSQQKSGERPPCPKIYYSSRTHSQLSQIIPELRRLNRNRHTHSAAAYAPTDAHSSSVPETSSLKRGYHALEGDNESDDPFIGQPQTRAVSLGSRKQLCINEDLRAKGGDLDERCRDLAKGTCCCLSSNLQSWY